MIDPRPTDSRYVGSYLTRWFRSIKESSWSLLEDLDYQKTYDKRIGLVAYICFEILSSDQLISLQLYFLLNTL